MPRAKETKMGARAGAWRPREIAPSFARGGYPDSTLRRLRAGWQRLCEDERDSVIAASLVASDLARLGAPPCILGEAARVLEDEVRHVEVCEQVLAGIGAEALDVTPGARRRPAGDGVNLEVKCARDLLAGFAVGEAMSAATFAACRRPTRDPLIRWALTELLRDEARHSGFGVRAGSWVIRNWDLAARAGLWSSCVAEMEGFERMLGGPIASDAAEPAPDAVSSALGMLPPHETCAAALACLPRWVLRPLAALRIVPRKEAGGSTTGAAP
jgi:hypothetical protein